jgi:DnaJ-class molecular chaperone
MTIPAGAQGGQRLRLRGQGLNRRRGGRGDEYVKLKIVIPPKLSTKEIELFEKLTAESVFDARKFLLDRLRGLQRENEWLRSRVN